MRGFFARWASTSRLPPEMDAVLNLLEKIYEDDIVAPEEPDSGKGKVSGTSGASCRLMSAIKKDALMLYSVRRPSWRSGCLS